MNIVVSAGSALSRVVAAAAALALTACGAARLTSRDSPTVARRPWVEVTTEHVSVVTDLPRDEATARAAEVEGWWQALAAGYQLLAPGATAPTARIPVVHFADCRDFQVVWGPRVGGAVAPSRDYEERRTVYTCEHEEAELRREVLLHELAHRMNHHLFGELPPWAEEGLASYFQSLRVEGGRLVLGHINSLDRSRAQRTAFLPSVEQLRGMDVGTFHRGSRDSYYAAFRLVHLLANASDDYNRRFRGYLGALRAGVARDEAWRDAFGELAADRLQEEYRLYLHGFEMRLWATAYAPPAPPAPRLRALSAGEIHEVWMLHLLVNGGAATVRRQLGFADRDDPTWPQSKFWHAVLMPTRTADGRAKAIGLLREQVAAHADDARAWLALVSLRLVDAIPATHTGLEATPPPGIDALAADVAGLVRLASTPAELNEVAWYYALRRQPATGIGFARRALVADLSCGDCEDTLALLLYQAGRPADAVAHQERAIQLWADERISDSAWTRLARYRAAARSKP